MSTVQSNAKDPVNSVSGWKIVASCAEGTDSMLKAIQLLNVSQIRPASIVYVESDRGGSRFKIAVTPGVDEMRLMTIARKIGQFASVRAIRLTLNGEHRALSKDEI